MDENGEIFGKRSNFENFPQSENFLKTGGKSETEGNCIMALRGWGDGHLCKQEHT